MPVKVNNRLKSFKKFNRFKFFDQLTAAITILKQFELCNNHPNRTRRTVLIDLVFDRPVSPCLTCWCAFVWHSAWIWIRVTLTSTSVTCYIFIVMVKVGNGIFVKWLIVVAQVRGTLNTFRCSIWIEGISDFIWKDSFIGWSILPDFKIRSRRSWFMIVYFHDRKSLGLLRSLKMYHLVVQPSHSKRHVG